MRSILFAVAVAIPRLTFSKHPARRNTAYFTSYLEDSHKTLNKPIWLTEVRGVSSPSRRTPCPLSS